MLSFLDLSHRVLNPRAQPSPPRGPPAGAASRRDRRPPCGHHRRQAAPASAARFTGSRTERMPSAASFTRARRIVAPRRLREISTNARSSRRFLVRSAFAGRVHALAPYTLRHGVVSVASAPSAFSAAETRWEHDSCMSRRRASFSSPRRPPHSARLLPPRRAATAAPRRRPPRRRPHPGGV